MMRFKWYFAIFLLATFVACKSHYESVQRNELDSKWISSPLHLKFNARGAYPSDGGYASLSMDYYSLEIKGDSIDFNLPYYGRAYQIDFSDLGYHIDNAKLSRLAFKRNRKNESTVMNFIASKEGKTYSFTLEFWEDGQALLDLTSIYRSKISFDGYLQNTASD